MDNQPSLFDPRPSGDQLRDAGIALVTENAGTWMDRARRVVAKHLRDVAGLFISGDEIRDAVQESIGPPHHPNAWGALTRGFIKSGQLLPTGRLVKSKRESNHSHANPEYEVSA